MKMKNCLLPIFVSAVSILVSAGTTSGQVVVQHLGATDPRTERFELFVSILFPHLSFRWLVRYVGGDE